MRILPLLPLRDIVVFPHTVLPLFVGREKSIAALEEAMNGDKEILLVAQKKAKTHDPSPDDVHQVGTIGTVIQLLRLEGSVKVLVEGKRRARIKKFTKTEGWFAAQVEEIVEKSSSPVEAEALVRSVATAFEGYAKLNKRIPPELLISVQSIDEPGRLSDTIVAHLNLKLNDKQELLDLDDPAKRLARLLELMQAEVEILQVEKKIRTRVKKQMEKNQKEYYLNEQMQAIQKELGERDEFKSELGELDEKLKTKRLSAEAKDKVKKELRKLRMMSPMSAEATVVRNYVDWVLGMPWDERTPVKLDVKEAQGVLDEDHHGLEKVKERIVEYLAVQALVKKIRGPILCLVGPPGVGKTSLGRSIARATGRKFVRLALGGVRDEAEIRGHRRTYIGAMPGKIIQSLKKAGSQNPVFLLDEVDKMSTDFRGDPSAALLEVLDPEQNNAFNDHYLDIDYDLSDVLFVTTANSLHSIPIPLQDRMEIIQLPGYTEWEKVAIAEKYLVPKQRKENGVDAVDLEISEDAIRHIIHRYTKEAGVRSLEREIATICRKIAKEYVERIPVVEAAVDADVDGDGSSKVEPPPAIAEPMRVRVTAKNVAKYLDIEKYREQMMNADDEIGLTNGLAVTMAGGDLLATEVTILPGKGKLSLTGKLGETMQESAQAAMSYVRSRSASFGLDRDFYQRIDVHVHFPEGAIPKDGPSAGITMMTSLVSALLRIPVRKDVAMTGEMTLRGRVLPIGGLKEKLLAAHRSGILTVIIPKENEKDLKDIPKRVLKMLTVHAVEHADEVLRHALRLEHPESFLPGPSMLLDWRLLPVAKPVAPDVDDDDSPHGPGVGVPLS